jgi:hypothetical protein
LTCGLSLFGLPCFRRHISLDRLEAIETSCLSDDRRRRPGASFKDHPLSHEPLDDHLLGWLLPSIWGQYRLAVRLKSGKRVRIWQGHRHCDFRHNIKFLQQFADLPVERG